MIPHFSDHHSPVLGQNTSKILAIGDIHGRIDLLTDLCNHLDSNHADQDTLEVYLGDYVDRGPKSREVIDFLIARRVQRNIICLAGNHEEMFLRALDGHHIEAWAGLGGRETAFSYDLNPRLLTTLPAPEVGKALREAVPEAHIAFLKDLELWYRDGDYIFAHAGLRPGVALESQSRRDLMWIRDSFLNYRGSFGGTVIHGHTPVREPDFRSNRINIDTGAYMTNKLTCLQITEAGASVCYQT